MLFEAIGAPGCHLGHFKAKVCPNAPRDAFFFTDFEVVLGSHLAPKIKNM